MRIARRIGLVVLGLVLFVVAALAVLLQADSFGPSVAFRGWLARQVEAVANGPDLKITIGRIEGGLPFGPKIDQITIADREGVWLTLEGVALSVAPSALLSSTVQIDLVEARRIEVARAPLPSTEPQLQEPSPPIDLDNLIPKLPLSIELNRLTVGELELGEALLGQAARLTIQGDARVAADGGPLSVNLGIDRIDQQPGTVKLALGFTPGDKQLTVDLKANEPEGGLLVSTLAIPGLPPFAASLDGNGTLDDWKGRLTAGAGDGLKLNADATIRAVPEGRAVTLDAGGVFAAFLGPEALPLVGDAPRLKAELVVAEDGSLTLKPLTATAAAGEVSLSGRVDPAANALDLVWSLAAGEESALRRMELPVQWRDIRLDGAARGTLDALDVTVKGGIHDLASNDPALAAVAGSEVTLDAAVNLGVNTGVVRIDRLLLNAAGARLAAEGNATGWGKTADVTVSLNAEDLSRLSGIAGRPLAGSIIITAPVTRSADGALSARLNGEINGLNTGTPADSLLGKKAVLAGDLAMTADGGMTVDTLKIDSGNLLLNGKAALRDGQLQADAALSVKELKALGENLGTPMGGGVALTASASGPIEQLAVEATLTGHELMVAERRFGKTDVTATATGLPTSPQGKVSASTELDGTGLSVAGGYGLEGQLLTLRDLAIVSGTNKIAGGLVLALDTLLAHGTLQGTLPQLKAFSELAGVKLDGGGGFKVVMTADGGKQAAKVDADFGNIKVTGPEGPLFAARKITLSGDVADALGTPSGKAKLDLLNGDAAGTELSKVTASVDGSLSKANFRAQVNGSAAAPEGAAGATNGRAPIALDVTGNLSREGMLNRIRLEKLTGSYAGESVRLAGPATAVIGEKHYKVDGLRLLISGGAQLLADLGLTDGKLAGTVKLEKLPLAIARVAAPTLELEGQLNAQATLGGTLAAPRADATLRVAGLRSKEVASTGLPPMDISLDARWRDQRVTVNGDVVTQRRRNGKQDAALKLAAALPLAMNAETMAVSVPPRARLDATVKGNIDVALANDILAASGDRAQGMVTVDVRAAGTLEAPELGGQVQLNNMRYENRASGAIITDMRGVLRAQGDSFTIQSFSGRTQGGGSIGASGSINLSGEPSRQLDLKITADNARLVANDLATANVGANLSVTGSLARPKLSGPIRILRADVQIPSAIPPTVVDLKVEEIGRGRKAVKVAPPKPAESAGFVMDLDMTVRAANQIFVRGRGADTEFAADLGIIGTSALPLVKGKVSMLKGQIDILNKNFEFKRGNIEFDGGHDNDPRLDLMAETEANGVTAQVEVTGTGRNPKIGLTSPQGLPQDELLAAILFGKTVDKLGAAEAIQLAQSAATLAGVGGGGGLMDNVRQGLGVDRLEFNTGADGKGGSLAAGRYVTDRVYVGVEQGIGSNQSKAKVEVDLFKGLKAEADMGSDSETSLGIKFELDY